METKSHKDAKNQAPCEGLKITIGRLHRPHGVRGEIKLKPFFEAETMLRFEDSVVTLAPEDRSRPFDIKLSSLRPGGKSMIASFDGIDSPDKAGRLTHCQVQVQRESMPDLPEGRYYYEEIVGLPVFTPDGEEIGVLDGFFSAGEKDVWSIKIKDGGELLVPCVPETLKEVDIKNRRIVLEPMEEAD